MDRDNLIEQLDRLIRINKDAETAFLEAAESIKNSELDTLFKGYAKQHAKFLAELQQEVERLGGSPSETGTVSGAIHRGWTDLKSTLSGHSAASLLASCESGEQSAEAAYSEVAKANPSGQTHTLIEAHRNQIKGFHTRLARLVGQTKDGVDFPKNE